MKSTYSDKQQNGNNNNNTNNNNSSINATTTERNNLIPKTNHSSTLPTLITTTLSNEKQKTIEDYKDSKDIESSHGESSDDEFDSAGVGQFDHSYIISSSHGINREETNFADTANTVGEDSAIKDTSDKHKEVSIVKAKDQSKINEQSDIVVGLASDILSSYKHITDNTEEFLLFVGLAIALGLGLFLSLVVWGMYRSNRLTRIKNRLRKPNSNIMASSDTTANGTMSDIIDAYINSPITGNNIITTLNMYSFL